MGDTYYRGTIFLHLQGSNYQDFIRSVEYLNSMVYKVDGLCPGHNECFAPKEDIALLYNNIIKLSSNQLEYNLNNGSKFYQFDHFNLLIP